MRPVCFATCSPSSRTIRNPGLTSRWTRTRRNLGQCSRPSWDASLPFRKSAVFTTATSDAQPEFVWLYLDLARGSVCFKSDLPQDSPSAHSPAQAKGPAEPCAAGVSHRLSAFIEPRFASADIVPTIRGLRYPESKLYLEDNERNSWRVDAVASSAT